MIERHRLSAESFLDLAGGNGGPGSIEILKDVETSKNLLLIRALLQDARRTPEHYLQAGTEGAFALLSEAERIDPVAVRELLSRPQVGAWAQRCLRLLSHPDQLAPLPLELAYFGSVAISAAVLTGIAGSATVAARNGIVCIPALGSAVIDTPDGQQLIELRASGPKGDKANLEWPRGVSQISWRPVSRVQSSEDGLVLSVEIDDLDPYRDGEGLGAKQELDSRELESWKSQLEEAWQRLVRKHRPRAEAISLGLTSIVPLRDAPDGTESSATSRNSFGAISMSHPHSPSSFAQALVHEFQHTKLGAILDLFPLYEPDARRFYSPWRGDPRPLGGLLQGAYAFLGVADFWRNEQQSGLAYARALDQILLACKCLQSSSSLTEIGERFVRAMREAAESYCEDVDRSTIVEARAANKEHLERWRLEHGPSADGCSI